MILKLILLLASFGFQVKGGVLFDSKETINSCVTLSIPEEDFKLLRKISGRLDTFLERNLEGGHQNLKKVLSAFGVDKDVLVKVDPEAPLENVLLQHQMTLHQDMKRMFLELKNLFLGLRSPNFSSKANDDVFSFGSFGSSFSKTSTLKTNLKPIIQAKTNSSQKTSGGRGISPYFGDRRFYMPTDSTFRTTDCSEILVAGDTKSGIYQIYPFRCQCSRPVDVYCDMETDGGGWTVFLSRINVSKPINFTRNWTDYKKGFGMPGEEHWLGNENVHILSHHRNYILRMEVKDGFGREIWGEWNVFKVESEEMKYKLTATNSNAKSTAVDLFSHANGNYFSTFDMDNDKAAKSSCAVTSKGGWWYNNCHNNKHPTGRHGKKDNLGIAIWPWSKVDSTTRYGTWLQLKIRPEICSNSISVAKLNTHNCAFN